MRIAVDGTELYVDVDGPQIEVRGQDVIERPTLLALHGGPGFDHVHLKPALGPLREHAQIVYVDLRGQGRSGRPPIETCTLEQTADDVAALCGRLGIERPVVLGHSAGGFVALHLAVRHPEVAGGLVLCSTAPTLEPISDGEPAPSLSDRAGPEATEAAARVFGGDMSPATMEEFARLVAPFYAGPTHMEVPLRLFPLSSFNAEVAQHFFQNLASQYDLRPRLGEIGVPTLVVCGAYDWVCPPAASRLLARSIPRAELLMLEDAGHFSFAEEPEWFLDAVAGFLGRIQDGAAA
ncbi:MAG TPA: alpha/beta hydrolase [Candidatus Binatia bacterium]|jgi:proline iminopeptidase|nr:alpha/beta hydrolase [Candidatus Binatia bacterium]